MEETQMPFPKEVKVLEVGPRDGFQSIGPWIDTSVKIQVIRALLDSDVDMIEAVSFISPKAIPQMKDAGEIIAALKGDVDMDRLFALVGNLRGAHQAAEAGLRNITYVISASEAHNRSNVNKTPAESVAQLRTIREELPGLHVKLSMATAFGCPFEGAVDISKLRFLIDSCLELDVRDICLCDTVGVASPMLTENVLTELQNSYDGVQWSMHFHNTRGMAATNTYVALQHGVDRFETAAGGLGGCPFAPGASGNMATEDLVYMLRDLDIHSNVNLDKVIGAAEMTVTSLNVCRDSKINTVTVNRIFQKG